MDERRETAIWRMIAAAAAATTELIEEAADLLEGKNEHHER